MKMIKDLVDKIDDELCGAKDYAEKYVEYKVKGEMSWANKFKDMASQELNHAMIIHDLAVKNIEEVSRVVKAPQKMRDAWDKAHVDYVEREAWIKQMLAL